MAEPGSQSVAASFPIRGWLAECSPEFMREFLALGRPKSFSAGSVLYRTDDSAAELFGIVSGVVTVQCRFAHPDAVLLHLLWPGEWFGGQDLLAGRSRRYTTVARTDVELLRVPGDEMRALLQRHPEGLAKLARNSVYGLDLAMQTASDLLIRDSAARCAAALLRLADRRWATGPHGNLPSEIPAASQTELAMLCNVSRKTFSRVIGEFSRRGFVTVGYRSLTVHDPAQLRLVADSG
jgi:CRP-like cAMP-binding protein